MNFLKAKILVATLLTTLLVSCNSTGNQTGTEDTPDSTKISLQDTLHYRNDSLVMQRYEEARQQQSVSTHQGRKCIYLTFDDGPSDVTPKILDILKNDSVHATFFVTGHHTKYLDNIRRAYNEGNAIGAHTYSHKYSIYRDFEAYFDDLEKIQEVIKQYTGSRTNIIRFPGGSSNTAYYKYNGDSLFMVRLSQCVRDHGYQYFDWNLASGDATGRHVAASKLIRLSCNAKKDEICLLMHDTFGKETTADALPSIIKFFKQQGYEFKTLTDTTYICHHPITPFHGKKAAQRKSPTDSIKHKPAKHQHKHHHHHQQHQQQAEDEQPA